MTKRDEHHTFKADEIPCQEVSDPVVLSKTPLVSVKMITYNHEPYIAQAIKGVLIQKTDFPIELIIGEDCSTDRTREIVLDYQKQYPEIIRVITSDNNVGVRKNSMRTEKACRGKYTAYCEGDDYWHHPNKLRKQVAFLEANPDYGMIHSDGHLFFVESGKLVKSYQTTVKKINAFKLRDDHAYYEILSRARLVFTAAVCVRKNVLTKVVRDNPEFHDTRFLMGDTIRWLEIARVSKIKYLRQPYVTHNILRESISHSANKNNVLKFQLSVKELFWHYLEKYETPPDANQIKRHIHLGIINTSHKSAKFDIVMKEMQELRMLNVTIPVKTYLFYLSSCNRFIRVFVKSIEAIYRYFRLERPFSVRPFLGQP